MLRFRSIAYVLLVLALTLAACGGGEDAEPAGVSAGRFRGRVPGPRIRARGFGAGPTIGERAGASGALRCRERGAVSPGVEIAVGQPVPSATPSNKPALGKEALGRTKPKPIVKRGSTSSAALALRPNVLIGVNSGMSARRLPSAGEKSSDGCPQTSGFIWEQRRCRGRSRPGVVGQALGMEDKAKEVVRETEAKFASIRKEHPVVRGQDRGARLRLGRRQVRRALSRRTTAPASSRTSASKPRRRSTSSPARASTWTSARSRCA